VALNLKNPEVEKLAAEVATLASESKTEAIRKALLERKARLAATSPTKRSQRAAGILKDFRAAILPEFAGRSLTKQEEDEILGFGPDGV
jgi:antitoxin VapB